MLSLIPCVLSVFYCTASQWVSEDYQLIGLQSSGFGDKEQGGGRHRREGKYK